MTLRADAPPSAPLRTYHPVQALLIGLTFVTGMVDAITYLDLGRVFAANMTGNAVLLGFALVGADQISVPASLVALASFLGGATLGGRLARELEQTQHRWIVTSLGLESGLLAAAMLGALLRPTVSDHAIVGLLALAMGLRTATVRRIAIPDLTTTVLTVTLAGLAADTQVPGGAPGAMGRRLAAVAAMLLGAATGALLLRAGGAAAAIGAALGLLLLGTAGYLATLRGTRS
jgi:uncharacterized membrane protein YoaK (UPF0700 family)